MELCSYGCEQEGKFQFKNGKWCCSRNIGCCPVIFKNRTEKQKGRTKETHDYLKERAEKMTGRTKETHDYIRKQAEKMTGRTKETREGIKKQAEKIRKYMKNGGATYAASFVSKDGRRRQAEKIRKYMKNGGAVHALRMCKTKPNKPETLILRILGNLYPNGWKYTGDYSFWINGKNPDFTCVNGKKLLIEHFGTYWHKGNDPEERKKIFAEFGYKTLVIWENELKNMKQIEEKIQEFIEKS